MTTLTTGMLMFLPFTCMHLRRLPKKWSAIYESLRNTGLEHGGPTSSFFGPLGPRTKKPLRALFSKLVANIRYL
jgi:hypothetical protein